MRNDLYRQYLALSHEVYLSHDLSIGYETSRLVGNMQSGEPISFCEEWHICHGTMLRIIIELVL